MNEADNESIEIKGGVLRISKISVGIATNGDFVDIPVLVIDIEDVHSGQSVQAHCVLSSAEIDNIRNGMERLRAYSRDSYKGVANVRDRH